MSTPDPDTLERARAYERWRLKPVGRRQCAENGFIHAVMRDDDNAEVLYIRRIYQWSYIGVAKRLAADVMWD